MRLDRFICLFLFAICLIGAIAWPQHADEIRWAPFSDPEDFKDAAAISLPPPSKTQAQMGHQLLGRWAHE
ncbi:MAG: hypothetical protein ACPGYV_01755, partial [Phycisphaeraceae bacterium]